jgi:hypothetical protein
MLVPVATATLLLATCGLATSEIPLAQSLGVAANSERSAQQWVIIGGGSADEPVWTVTKIKSATPVLESKISFAGACRLLREGMNVDAILVATNVYPRIVENRLGIVCEAGSNVCITARNLIGRIGKVLAQDPKAGTMGLDLMPTASMVGRMNRHVCFALAGDRFIGLECSRVDRRKRLIWLLNRLRTGKPQRPDDLGVTASDSDIALYVNRLFGALGVHTENVRVDPTLLWIVFETAPTANVVGVADFLSDPIGAPETDFDAPFEVYERDPPAIDE